MFEIQVTDQMRFEVLKALGKTVMEKKKAQNKMVSIYDLLKTIRISHPEATKLAVEAAIDIMINKGVVRYYNHNFENNVFRFYGVSRKGWQVLEQFQQQASVTAY